MTKDRYPGDQATQYDMNRFADFDQEAAHRSSGSILVGDAISACPMRASQT
jgi:hypothetical protein